jgi:hypothetical protein
VRWQKRTFVELHLDLVFRFGIGWYFPGILPTDTKGKLGRDLSVSYFWREPLFPLKRGCGPLHNSAKRAKHHEVENRNTIHPIQKTQQRNRKIRTNRARAPLVRIARCRLWRGARASISWHQWQKIRERPKNRLLHQLSTSAPPPLSEDSKSHSPSFAQ